jgi:cyclopropane fatty-acyl-phospholipid synthase-like methyltransferase
MKPNIQPQVDKNNGKVRYGVDDETGIWHGSDENLAGHMESPQLKEALTSVFNKKGINSMYDFGCGLGGYTKHFIDSGIKCKGYDGNPDTPKLTNNLCGVLNLAEKFEFEPLDYVLSLEVGEHIPKEFETTFIENIHNHNTKGCIVSWATLNPYQGGHGHVNNQDNDYIIARFIELGYDHDLETQNYIKESIKNGAGFGYLQSGLMAFSK